MTIVVGITLISFVLTIAFRVALEHQKSQQRRQARQRLIDHQMRHLTPLHQPERAVLPWSPEEREALGINDTDRFIKETDRIIKEAEWKRLVADSGETVGSRMDLDTVEIHAWGNPEPVRTYHQLGGAWVEQP